MKVFTPLESQGNLFGKGVDLRQQTTGLGRLRQMETKSVSVRLFTASVAVLPPGTRALLPHSSTDSDRYIGATTIRDQRTFRKHIKFHHVLGEFLTE